MPRFATDLRKLEHRTRPPRIASDLRAAIKDMVHNALSWQEAAKAHGVTTQRMREAFEIPHVIQLIRRERVMLRESACTGNEATFLELRNDRKGKPSDRIAAAKALEELRIEHGDVAGQAQPPQYMTVAIAIVERATPALPQPTIDLQATEKTERAPD